MRTRWIGFVLALAFAPVAWAQTFEQAPVYGTGGIPRGVATADFDGDGLPDVVTANDSGGNVSVLLGTGTGTLGAAVHYPAGGRPFHLAVGDFNEDGEADVAVALFGSNAVAVLLGTGTGALGTATTFATGSLPFSVAVGYIDSDSHLDLAVANIGADTVSILLGTGTGSFGAATSLTVGSQPSSVAIADFNGDAVSDLAVTRNVTSSNVTVFPGTGGGAFGAGTTYSAQESPRGAVVGLFNGDANLDLAVANAGSESVTVLPGDGSGGFGTGTHYRVGPDPWSMVRGDFDGDGFQDLAVANVNGGSVSVIRGTGTSTMAVAPARYGARNSARSIAAADFEGDGLLDLAVSCTNPSSVVAILLGEGGGRFAAPEFHVAGNATLAVAAQDLDDDGQEDLAVASFFTNGVAVLRATGPGAFGAFTNHAAGTGPVAVAIADLDDDSVPDLVTANQNSNNVSVLLGTGGAGFASPVHYGLSNYPSWVATGDFNEDTLPDVAVTVVQANVVTVFLGTGGGGLGSPTEYTVTDGPAVAPNHVAVGDLNGDAHLDLVTANPNGGARGMSVLFGAGDGTFSAPTIYSAGSVPVTVTLGQLNDDALPDVAVANQGDDTVAIFHNAGSGALAFQGYVSTGPSGYAFTPRHVVAADFNLDGALDLATPNSNSHNVSILVGDGAGGFAPGPRFAVGYDPRKIAVGDFNDDGKPDLAVVNMQSDDVSILLNTTPIVVADLAITKDDGQTTAYRGDLISYTITVTNVGPDAVTSVKVTDDVPAAILDPVFTPSAGAYDGGSGLWTGLSLGAGGTATLTLSGTVDPLAAGPLVNTATVAPPGAGFVDPDTANNSATDTDAVASPETDLAVAKDDGLSTVAPGALVTYTIVVANQGSRAVTGASVTDPLPATLTAATWTCAPSSGAACAASGSGSIGDSVDLPVGGSVAYALTATVAPGTTYCIRNTASVSPPVGVTDLDPSNDAATDATGITPSLSIGSLSVREGNGGPRSIALTVRLSAPTCATVTVGWATANGTATAPSDYAAASGTLTFPPGSRSQTLAVTIVGDTAREPDERFFVNLSAPANATISRGRAVVTLTTDDR